MVNILCEVLLQRKLSFFVELKGVLGKLDSVRFIHEGFQVCVTKEGRDESSFENGHLKLMEPIVQPTFL